MRMAPWIVVSLVLVLAAGGLTGGYLWLVRQACSGKATARVVASPETAQILEVIGQKWAATEPAVKGKCASVEIATKDSAQMAIALQNPWDPKVNGAAPDVWVPQSTAWIRRAAVDADAERMLPDLQPSIARSPAVLAMPKPMAEKLGWPQKPITWQTVIDNATKRTDWGTYGQPDWGAFRLGMTNPATSTAGLLALTAILDRNDDEDVSAAERQGLIQLRQAMTVYTERTDDILTEYTKLAGGKPAAGLAYVSAFPALEQDVVDHNLRNPKAPLVAIYPEQNVIEADHPFLVLKADWVSTEARAVATEFMNFVRGRSGEEHLLNAGFRDPNRVPGKDLTAQNGVSPQLTALPRAVLLPDSVTRAINTWTALTRPTNILLVLDVSGSMVEPVPGSGGTRMDLAKRAASEAIDLFSDDARVGLWVFSSALSGQQDHRVVVPLDRVGQTVNGRSRRDQMKSSINALRPQGATGLYDTTLTAQKHLLENFQKDAVNLVVIMTDGKNEDETPPKLSKEALLDQLQKNNADAARKVLVTTVGFGEAADYAALQEISRVTGGIAFESRAAFDINQVLQAALFSDL
jgi:Ca-activated chloride channel family protein